MRQCSHATFTFCSTHLLLSHETVAASEAAEAALQIVRMHWTRIRSIYASIHADPIQYEYMHKWCYCKDTGTLCLHAIATAFLFTRIRIVRPTYF